MKINVNSKCKYMKRLTTFDVWIHTGRLFMVQIQSGRQQQRIQIQVDFADGVVGRVGVVVHQPNLKRFVLQLGILHLQKRIQFGSPDDTKAVSSEGHKAHLRGTLSSGTREKVNIRNGLPGGRKAALRFSLFTKLGKNGFHYVGINPEPLIAVVQIIS